MADIEHKAGDTFRYLIDIPLVSTSDEVQVDSSWSGACQVRDASKVLISTAVFTWVSARECEIKILDTSSWVETRGNQFYLTDVQFTSPDNEAYSSQTLRIRVSRDVTQN